MNSTAGGSLDFFNIPVRISQRRISSVQGEILTPAVKEVIRAHVDVTAAEPPKPDRRLVTFRELSDAGPLVSRFTANTSKIVETHYSGNLADLLRRCRALGGEQEQSPSYDAVFRFNALPKVPILFQFNDVDDMMPAKALFLFRSDALQYLDLKGLMTVSTFLTGMLIRSH